MSKLLIVESPTKARTIGKMLGKDYKILASMGHIRDLPDRELGVDIEHDFKPIYVDTPRSKGIVKELRAAAKTADEIYLAPDPDREGEAIAWHLKEVLQKGVKAPFHRVTFHEITRNAIENALRQTGEIDINRVDAQQARRVLDRLVGYQVSPLLWSQVEKGSSAGRVQSAALRLVVERERAILDFKPVEYWTFSLVFRTADGREFVTRLFKINGKDFLVGGKEEADRRMDAIRNGVPPVIGSVSAVDRKRNAPPPFTTSTMQQAANVRFHYSASNTMRYAQQLYEGVDIGGGATVGLITYMRTDSVTIASEAQQAALAFIRESYGTEFAPSRPNFFRNKAAAQEAHEAIRPTDVRRTPEDMAPFLDSMQLKLYTLIWRRFVASQMTPAIAKLTTVDVNITGSDRDNYTFRASATVPVFAGFSKIYEDGKPDKPEEAAAAAVLRALRENDPVMPGKFETEQKFTEPPPRYSEASLIKELEENGIGRPSTYATILRTIQDREYVSRDQGKLAPTELGFSVNDFLVAKLPELFDIGFTASMEQELDEVEEGKVGWTSMLHDFYNRFTPWLDAAKNSGAPESSDAEALLSLLETVTFAPPEKAGKRTYDDGKFYRSVREKFEKEHKITARQYQALVNLAAKYRPLLSPAIPIDAKLQALLDAAAEELKLREQKREAAMEAAAAAAKAAGASDLGVVFDAFQNTTFEPPTKKGRFTYDDKKFFTSLKKQHESGKPLSEKQLAALGKMAAKYRSTLTDPTIADKLSGSAAPGETAAGEAAPAANSEEVKAALEELAKVKVWAEPVKKGRFTYDDKEFYESVRRQFFTGKVLSPRQVSAIKKLLAKYHALAASQTGGPVADDADGAENVPAAASAVPASPAAEESPEVRECLDLLSQVVNWAEPVKKGRFTFDDKKFFESLKKQHEAGKRFSEKQLAALKKLADSYRS